MTTWMTVTDAEQATNKSKSTIYRILSAPNAHVRTLTGADGVLRINAADLVDAIARRRPGRPRGTASLNRWRAGRGE